MKDVIENIASTLRVYSPDFDDPTVVASSILKEVLAGLKPLRPYLEKRTNELVGCTENSPEEAEVKAISDVLDIMQTAARSDSNENSTIQRRMSVENETPHLTLETGGAQFDVWKDADSFYFLIRNEATAESASFVVDSYGAQQLATLLSGK